MSVSKADNELMTRVEGDAPMGQFLRQNYWFPAGLSSTLEADGAPERIRLLGRNYVAFRSTDGRVGVFNEGCPHRGASLMLARNEDNALRCIFHGWKFRVDGTVVECPTQPDHQEAFCKTVPLKHYPTREAAGLFWVWLGGGEPKKFPDFEWTALSGENIRPIRQVLKFNWIQSVEGLVDSAHVAVLHQSVLQTAGDAKASLAAAGADMAPVYEFEDIPGGFRYASIRKTPDDKRYIRVTAYTAPWYCFIPFNTGNCVISVPIDDVSTALYFVHYNKDGKVAASAYGPTSTPNDWPPYLRGGPEERWGQDRDAMKRGHFTGFLEHFMHEDFAVAESQGTIADRSEEFLNVGDRAIMHFRRLLLKAVKESQAGKVPGFADLETIPFPDIRARADVVPKDTEWRTYFV